MKINNNNSLHLIVYFSFIFFGLVFEVRSEATALEIAQKVYDRDDGKDSWFVSEMILVDSGGSERIRKLESAAKDYGELNKRYIRFTEPEAIKGTSLLILEKHESSDDQFLYLPSIRRTRRISSDQKDRSFVNTDFTYEDLERRKVERDEYKLIRTEMLNNWNTWVLERVSKDEDDSQYGKVIMWVAKDSYVVVKSEFYDKDGKLFKKFEVHDLKQIEGIWTVMHSTMQNLEEEHKTINKIFSAKYNNGVSDEVFTEAYLEHKG